MILPNREEIKDIYREGEEAVIELILSLEEEIRDQEEIIKGLRGQISKDSRNSSKPPSSAGYKKRTGVEVKRECVKNNGGQKGHEGHTLMQVEEPNYVVLHGIKECVHCKASLEREKVIRYERRQVFGIPPIKMEVTEHRTEVKICPCCGSENKGEFPAGVDKPVQYDGRVKAIATYLNQYQLIPLERTCEIFEDIFGHRLSEEFILQSNEKLAECVRPSNSAVKEMLIKGDVVNFDETGLRVEDRLNWLHLASNSNLTYYEIHEKRGKIAMDEIGILPKFSGTAVHDHWKPYISYDNCSHSFCNSHHIRELNFVREQYRQDWAEAMESLLLEIKKEVEETKPTSIFLSASKIREFENKYDKIIEEGYKVNPQAITKKGRVKQTPPKNLLDRLHIHKQSVLAFMYDFRVPFDNNQGERDLRMMKLKQKISGTFRTRKNANVFCLIRGYISTARKNEQNVIESIKNAFYGEPFIPILSQ